MSTDIDSTSMNALGRRTGHAPRKYIRFLRLALIGPPIIATLFFGFFGIIHLYGQQTLQVKHAPSSSRFSSEHDDGAARSFLSKAGPNRLVVFGDSWSDNGEYLVEDPLFHSYRPNHVEQGPSWPEWVCKTVLSSF